LPLRCDLAGDPTFLELLSRIREVAAGADDHQILTLERIIEIVHCKNSLNHQSLFQVLFQVRNFPETSARLQGLDVAAFDFDAGVAAFDLTMELTVNFNTALFDVGTARGILGHYQTHLEGIVTDPNARISALPPVNQAELHNLGGMESPASDSFRRPVRSPLVRGTGRDTSGQRL